MFEREMYQILRKPMYDFFRTEIDSDYAENIISQLDNRFVSSPILNYRQRKKILPCKKIYFLENERFLTDPWLKNIRNVHNCEQETLPPTGKANNIFILINLILSLPLILKYLFLTKFSITLLRILVSKVKFYHTEVLNYKNYDFKDKFLILTNFYNHFGLIKVAHDYGCHVIDVQHSMISFTHKGYDFQNWVFHDFIPDSLYLFSNFWKSQISFQNIALLTYKSDDLFQQTSSFVYDKNLVADDGRIIIFAQKTKMKVIDKLLDKFEGKKQNIYLKPHPKQDCDKLRKKYNIIDNLIISGSDKLFVFDSTVCLDLYELGIFANIYADVANDIPKLQNLSKVTQLDTLKPVNTHWEQRNKISLYSTETQILE